MGINFVVGVQGCYRKWPCLVKETFLSMPCILTWRIILQRICLRAKLEAGCALLCMDESNGTPQYGVKKYRSHGGAGSALASLTSRQEHIIATCNQEKGKDGEPEPMVTIGGAVEALYYGGRQPALGRGRLDHGQRQLDD